MFQASPHSAGEFALCALEPRLLLCSAARTSYGDIAEAPPTSGFVLAAATPPRPASTHGLEVPSLHSYASAAAKIYLDFTGNDAMLWGELRASATPPFDQDGNPAAFTGSEIDAIREIWARIAEKFSPFRIDVTTDDPGNVDDGKTLKVVFGGDGAWYGSRVGGLSFVGSFVDDSPNIVFIFTRNMNDGDPKYTAEAAAHEIGHAFGLDHQAEWRGQALITAYNTGSAVLAPIMGISYDSARGVWWRGPTPVGPDSIQDDMAVLAGPSNGFGYRPDDHANSLGKASNLDAGSLESELTGVIGNANDVDYFRFSAGNGALELHANTVAAGAMLDLKMELRDGAGNVVASADTRSLGESISTSITAGTYFLSVASQGAYGDVGQYTITGWIPPPVHHIASARAVLPAPRNFFARPWSSTRIRLTWTDVWSGEDRLVIERSVDRRHWRTAAEVKGDNGRALVGPLRSGVRYFFRIRAAVDGQFSSYSRIIAVRF